MNKYTIASFLVIFMFGISSCSETEEPKEENESSTSVSQETKDELNDAIELQQETEALNEDVDQFLDSL